MRPSFPEKSDTSTLDASLTTGHVHGLGVKLPSAPAAAAAVGSLTRSVPTGAAGLLASTAAAGTPVTRTVTPLAGPAEPGLCVALRATGVPTLPKTLAGAIAVKVTTTSAPTGLVNREVRGLPLRTLALGSRQRGANQSPMDRPLVVGAVGPVDMDRIRSLGPGGR
jgi:hypothetical protein